MPSLCCSGLKRRQGLGERILSMCCSCSRTFLQQAKALAAGTEGVTGPGLQDSDLQVPNSLIPAPFVIANVCRSVLKFSHLGFGLKYSRMSHPVAFGLLPAILQPALGGQCCSPSHMQSWYGCTAAPQPLPLSQLLEWLEWATAALTSVFGVSESVRECQREATGWWSPKQA